MSDINGNDIIDNLRSIDKNKTLLDMLIEFEHVLDTQGMYGYEHWKLGEVVEGPNLSRYWLFVKLMYPYKKMPDPSGIRRLIDLGCEVEFKKGQLKKPVDVKSPDDLDEDGNAKMKTYNVWLIDIWMPRKFVDEFNDGKVDIGDDEVDVEDLTQAYDKGLDDESNIGQQDVQGDEDETK